MQLHEIGQEMTFEELDFYGDLPHYVNSLHYVPYGCDLSSSLETNCSKLVNLTVTPEVDEKSYKCRSLNRQDNVDKYSPVGTVKGVWGLALYINCLLFLLSPCSEGAHTDPHYRVNCYTACSSWAK